MKILTDTHTHTMVSAHAYSTLLENVRAAKERKLELLATTNHAPAIPDGAHEWHFHCTHELPDVIDGVKMLYGAELNVLDPSGRIDLPEFVLKMQGLHIASLHEPCYNSQGKTDHTKTWLNVLKNPYVDILGHVGRGDFPFDHNAVAKAAKEADVCIEINCKTLSDSASREVCADVLACCKKYGTKITVGSDSHFCGYIGDFENAISLLSEVDYPEELVVSRNADSLLSHLKNKNKYFRYAF